MAYCQTVVSPPLSTTGLLRGSATFFCEVDFQGGTEYMAWFHGSDTLYYYKGGYGKDTCGQYEAQRHGNLFLLTIKNLEFSNAGRYGCKVLGVYGSVYRYAELNVLGE